MKVIVKGGVILSLLLFVFACNSGYEKTPFEGKQFRIDTLHIKVPENRSPTLANLTVQEFMGNEYLIGFNFQTYSIDYYDLKGFEFVKSIRLTKEGPNFVSGVSAFAVLPNGELLIADNNYLTKVDQDGNVSDRISLNGLRSGLTGLDFERCMLTVNRYSGLQYDYSKNSVLMEVYFYDLPGNLKFAPFMVEIELSSKAASLIDLPSISRAFLNRESMGELNGVNFLRVNNEILVSPKYSFEVFKIKADLAERFEVNSAYTNNKADPLKLLDKRLNQSKIEHNHNSVEFYSIVHDPINGNVLSCS